MCFKARLYKPNMPIDVLVVGQGLAGSLLAWVLIRRGLSVVVVDDGDDNASQVAAGLINPITGRRLVKSSDVDQCLPSAMATYRELESIFRQPFFVPLPMQRLLKTPAERRLAEQRLLDAGYRAYLQSIDDAPSGVVAANGRLLQMQTGYLRTRPLLERMREFLVDNAAYRRARFDYAELKVEPDLQWRDLRPRHVVFCEGHKATANPWFGRLPFQPAKGEILHCQAPEAIPQRILNYGYWLIADGPLSFKTGATFEPEFRDANPSIAARQKLLDALALVCPALASARVIEHRAGIRPTTLDKQPLIGRHPAHRKLHIFNGFGAKGSLAIPGHAHYFADALQQQAQLPAHCDIRRYHDTHFPA